MRLWRLGGKHGIPDRRRSLVFEPQPTNANCPLLILARHRSGCPDRNLQVFGTTTSFSRPFMAHFDEAQITCVLSGKLL
jgi:hypothetical protein